MRSLDRRVWTMLLVVLLAIALVPATVAQEGTPAPGAGSPSRSMTRAAFDAQLETVFALDEPERRGGQLLYGAITDIDTLNPMLAGDVFTFAVTNLLYETLVTISPIDGQPAPALADFWETAADGRSVTFHVHPAARWHDGTDVTADDVVFTVEVLLNDSPYGPYMREILDSAQALDPDTVVLHATQPSATFLYEIMFPIMPKHIWDGVPFADWAGNPGSTGVDASRVIGTGPFRFAEWVPDDHIRLVRFDGYFGVVPAIDEFIYRVLPDDTAILNALEAGEVDLVDHVPGNAVPGLRAVAGLRVDTFDSLFAAIYAYNLDPAKTPLFQDRAVRQALFLALDREAMTQSLLGGFAHVAHGSHPPLSVAYAPERIATHYDYDPEHARALLTEAGWTDTNGDGTVDKDGHELRFEVLAPEQSPPFAQMAVYMQDAWRAIGVEANVTYLALQSLFDRYAAHDFDVVLSGEFLPPYGSMDYLFACAAYEMETNSTKYCNPRYDELATLEKRELDSEKRVDLLIEQANIVNDDLPIAFLAFFDEHAAYSDRLRNYRPTGYATLWSVPWVWIAQ
jgi:peptide/nickel transport system substrate-binding protein